MSILDTAPVLWDPAVGRIYTYMVPAGRPDGQLVSAWGRESLEEMMATGKVSEQSVVLPQAKGLALEQAAHRTRWCTGPQPISAERFHELLNVLYPAKWHRGERSESFMVPEPITGDLYQWCVRIGQEHFGIVESEKLSHQELCELCSQA